MSIKHIWLFIGVILITFFISGCQYNITADNNIDGISNNSYLNPSDYNVAGLRVNANYKVDISKWFPQVESETYWVPAVTLGKPNNTIEEIKALKGRPEEAREMVDNLFEALMFMHLCIEPDSGNAKTYENKISWQFPKPAIPAIRDGKANCAASANIIKYLLSNDYEEVGFVWRHTSFDAEYPGGHCTSYIKQNGLYYFFDPRSLIPEDSHYPIENGTLHTSHSDLCAFIIESIPTKYVIYCSQISKYDEAIFTIFYDPYGHFAIGNKGGDLYYPKSFDASRMIIWKDPNDEVNLLKADFNPTPPKNQYNVKDYADFMPYTIYISPDAPEPTGTPTILSMPTDG